MEGKTEPVFSTVEEPTGPYLPESETKRTKHKVGFNGLTPTEWAALSKSVWNDVSSPRNRHQLEYGAVFPVKLAARLLQRYSKEGDSVLDPFAGIGTTLIAAQNLKRLGVGFGIGMQQQTVWHPARVDFVFWVVGRTRWEIGIFRQGLRALIPTIEGETRYPVCFRMTADSNQPGLF